MKKSKDPIKIVTVILTEPIHKAICAYAKSRHWNVSFCIREAIELYIYEKTRKRKRDKA